MAARTNSHGRYRVVQWATGNVGKVAIRHFAENPVFDLSACWSSARRKSAWTWVKSPGSPRSVCGRPTTSMPSWPRRRLCDVRADLAGRRRCVPAVVVRQECGVHQRALLPNRIHRRRFRSDRGGVSRGRASFHGGGIHPGFAGDLLPLTLARIASRIDQLHVYEVVDFGADPSKYLVLMGMGATRSSSSPVHRCWASRCRTSPRA